MTSSSLVRYTGDFPLWHDYWLKGDFPCDIIISSRLAMLAMAGITTCLSIVNTRGTQAWNSVIPHIHHMHVIHMLSINLKGQKGQLWNSLTFKASIDRTLTAISHWARSVRHPHGKALLRNNHTEHAQYATHMARPLERESRWACSVRHSHQRGLWERILLIRLCSFNRDFIKATRPWEKESRKVTANGPALEEAFQNLSH